MSDNTLLILILLMFAVAGILAWLLLRARRAREDAEAFDLFDAHYRDPLDELPPPNPLPDDRDDLESPREQDYLELDERHLVPDPPRELVLILYLVHPEGAHFHGADLLAVLQRLGFTFGEMNIFHHHGPEEHATQSGEPVFSIANLVEPGVFDLDQLPITSLPGLSLFMRLPGPLDGRVAFEFMLSLAHRLSEGLQGQLLDEQRRPLTQETLLALRHRIESFSP